MWLQTAINYAKAELKAERFPEMGIYTSCGEYHLTDHDGHLLKDRAFASKDAAVTARSRIIAKASKAHWAS